MENYYLLNRLPFINPFRIIQYCFLALRMFPNIKYIECLIKSLDPLHDSMR